MSPYFEDNYDEYIDLMLDVSHHGLWESWIEFFLKGLEESCKSVITTAAKLQDLQSEYHSRVQQARSSALLGQLIDDLFEHPATTIPYASRKLKIAYNAAKNNVQRLIGHGILSPVSFEIRPKVLLAEEIIAIVS